MDGVDGQSSFPQVNASSAVTDTHRQDGRAARRSAMVPYFQPSPSSRVVAIKKSIKPVNHCSFSSILSRVLDFLTSSPRPSPIFPSPKHHSSPLFPFSSTFSTSY
ncbi:hypothetical protein VTO42DRAFT_6934 [Malbranchea cinnamomea]